MKPRGRFTSVFLVGALLGLLLSASGVHAQEMIIIGGKLHSGIFGLAPEQTARLNVVNIERGVRAPACELQVTFYDTMGEIVKRTRHRLMRGTSSFVEVAFQEIVNPPDRAGRRGLRAEIVGFNPQPDPPGCVATLEVYNQATGRTAVFLGGPDTIPAAES